MVMGPVKKEIPWCTILLVILATACHVTVLLGNYKTASAIEDLGTSTQGWSGIGLDLSESLHNELDVIMTDLTAGLTACINLTLLVQGLVDESLALTGSAAESLLQSNATQAMLLLQEHIGNESGAAAAEHALALHQVQSLTNTAVEDIVDKLTQQVIDALQGLMDQLKPALERVGELITKFGTKIQTVISGFSITLDRVQKLFDQVMQQLSSSGARQDELEYNTFTLYDVDGDGTLEPEDLLNVARLYGVACLKGKKADQLVAKYDANGDGVIDKSEYSLFVDDPSMPNLMSTVLRIYSEKLAEIAGNVAAAKFRDEVAYSVTNYLLLVCAKNLTKVGWVSDALSNGSLPLEFTADVMVQMALSVDDPNILTTVDTGALVVGTMLELNKANTVSAYSLLSNETFWITEGFDPDDQSIVLKRVDDWMNQTASNDTALLESFRATKQQLREKKMKVALNLRRSKRDAVYDQLFASKTAQALQLQLLGGSAAASGTNDAAEQAIHSGVPAVPETLQFAKFLSYNASDTAKRFQDMCFDYSSESSNAASSFSTKIASMVNKFKGFIAMLESYSTPTGISLLEDQVQDFMQHAADDLKKAIKKEMSPSALQTNTEPVGLMLQELLGKDINQMSSHELEVHLTDHTTHAVSAALSHASAHVNSLLGQLPTSQGPLPLLQMPKQGKSAVALISDREASVMQHAANRSLKDATDILLTDMAGEHGVWDEMSSVLQSFSSLLPQATSTLKLARREVSMVSSTLDSVFTVFEAKGSPLFEEVAHLYRLMWTLYFCFIMPLSLLLLLYAFWAGGFLGGPGNLEDESTETEPPAEEKTCWWRLKACCSSCCTCFSHSCHTFHDMELCFWSCIILMQVVGLVMFFISILLCILAGVKVFLAEGCAQVYVLGDATICGQTMMNLREFLASFLGVTPLEDLASVCTDQSLLTCEMISSKMKASGQMTTIFSFLAVFFSAQFLIESAVLHTKAIWRRKVILAEKEIR